MAETEPPLVAETLSEVVAVGRGRPSLQLAAEALKTSPRTLQRRLNAAGVSFSEILGRSAAARARSLLAHSGEDIKTISVQLGYRDPSSFSRAFRRWTGQSPHEYRQQHRRHRPASRGGVVSRVRPA
jgi:AraC-like DNA-binding protein